MTALTWPAVVAEVPHDAGCISIYRATIQDGLTEWGPSPRPCNCARDARIAKGIEAVRDQALCEYGFDDEVGNPNVPLEQRRTEYDARCLAEHLVIFMEASK